MLIKKDFKTISQMVRYVYYNKVIYYSNSFPVFVLQKTLNLSTLICCFDVNQPKLDTKIEKKSPSSCWLSPTFKAAQSGDL